MGTSVIEHHESRPDPSTSLAGVIVFVVGTTLARQKHWELMNKLDGFRFRLWTKAFGTMPSTLAGFIAMKEG